MTPPGGSRRGADGGGDAAAGAGGEGARELGGMRAVWREMRDEAPPDRGLGDLLAAARAKAEVMRPRPSGWQRLIALLRRPPVLALATAVVLLGGAALLGRRMAAGPPSAGRDERMMPAAGPPSGFAPAAGPPSAPVAAPPSASAPVAGAGSEAVQSRRDSAAPADDDASGGRAHAVTAPGSGAPEPVAQAVLPAQDGSHRTAPQGSVEHAKTSDDRTGAFGSPPRAGASRDGAKLDTAAAIVSELGAAPAGAAAADAALARLRQQCDAAAQRGDCATVRRLVAQITRGDRGYRARLGRDSAIAKCLAD